MSTHGWRYVVAATCVLAMNCPPRVTGAHHDITFEVDEWVVDFLRPTVALSPHSAHRETPYNIPDANRKAAILVNGRYPGPTINVTVNDTVSINVINRMSTFS